MMCECCIGDRYRLATGTQHTGYTYDHLSWREPFRDGTWFGAVPTLTAAAAATRHMRLGTLVTSVKPRSRITG